MFRKRYRLICTPPPRLEMESFVVGEYRWLWVLNWRARKLMTGDFTKIAQYTWQTL